MEDLERCVWGEVRILKLSFSNKVLVDIGKKNALCFVVVEIHIEIIKTFGDFNKCWITFSVNK